MTSCWFPVIIPISIIHKENDIETDYFRMAVYFSLNISTNQ